MVDVVLNFTQPDESLGPTSFTRDAAHARERQASALSSSTSSRSAPGPTAVRLIDGRIGHDHAEAERTAVAELLGGGGRGFVLLWQHSAVTDWHDEAQVTGTYYKEITELIERLLPGSRALTPGNHVIRTEEPESYPVQPSPVAGYQGTAGVCHNDFAENHGADLVSRPNELTQAMFDSHRVLEISTWRNIDPGHPIERVPLAVCDRSSLRRDDLQAVPLIFGDISEEENPSWADIYFVTHREGQRWTYFPAMRDDELLLLVQYDSRPEVPHRSLTTLEEAEGGRGFIPPPHSAVELPGTEGARKRLSLDFRVVCLLPLAESARL